MPTRDEVLVEKTFKDQCEGLDARVFYTLSHNKQMQSHRNSKAIAHIVAKLHAAGQFSDEEIDELLLDCAGS